MVYNVFVKGFNGHIEEVIIEINGIELIVFMPFGISFEPEKSKQYPILISLVVLDDLEVQEEKDGESGFFRIDDSFSYIIKGILNLEKKTINVGFELSLEDEIEEFIDEMWPYDGKKIQIRVDRINVEFLEE
ncbi:hypothetical protein P9D51_21495 [Bacillus sonorensis]|uniref:hypothetical protein n=1 Tax=Bacillus sonorensis TaxID=119858 RepID=UPI002DBB4998|nr:hypothetical protein [Bacillus sonorensis]MEC1353448.1 hypothetical protein [Bacillus sonorensis]MEC1428631.1 hypothetical protein [Bacillus sonorensis]MEC1441478.1 hypothetical protein [Bacillus sonorensis]